MNHKSLERNGGAIIFGLVLLAVGGYYFLRNTLGAWIILRNLTETEQG